MAVVLQTLVDSDFEHVVKVTTTSTNTNASIVDASALEGAASNPRLAIVACQWTTGSQTNILFDASSNDVALSLNGNGAYNTGAAASAEGQRQLTHSFHCQRHKYQLQCKRQREQRRPYHRRFRLHWHQHQHRHRPSAGGAAIDGAH